MGYTAEQYLLDKLWIQETMTRLYHHCDARTTDKLPTLVLAPTVTPDYSLAFGWPVASHSSAELTAQWSGIMNGADATQHAITGIISELAFPADAPPAEARVFANAQVYLRKTVKVAGEEKEEVRVTTNGGRMEGWVVRVSDEDARRGGDSVDGNPWRLREFKIFPCYDEGGKEFWGS